MELAGESFLVEGVVFMVTFLWWSALLLMR